MSLLPLIQPYPKFRAFDATGNPLVGGKLYTYEPGTSTNKATYTDVNGGTANANPVILDADGEADVWYTGTAKLKLTDSSDNLIWTIDNVSGGGGLSGFSEESVLATDGQTTFNSASLSWSTDGSNLDVVCNGALMERGTNEDYTITDTNTIEFNSGRDANDKVTMRVRTAVQYNNAAAANVSIADASSYWVGTDAEAVLDEIGQHIVSAQKFIPIALHSLRETTNFDVGNAAANGGILASDTTPVLDAINAATDGCQRLLWAASNNDQVTLQIPLPPDFDPANDLVLHMRIVSGGTTDAVGFTVDSFFNEGDTKVVDTSGTNQTTTYAEVIATIAAADIPAGAQTITIGLTPVAHTTDTLALSALWLEYTGTLLTS